MKRFLPPLWDIVSSVDTYRACIYSGLFLWGIGKALRPDPMAVSVVVPHPVYVVWLVLHLAVPPIILLGMYLSAKNPPRWWEYIPRRWVLRGWELQWGGEAAIFFIAAVTSYAFLLSDELSSDLTGPAYAGAAAITVGWALRDAVAVGRCWGGDIVYCWDNVG